MCNITELKPIEFEEDKKLQGINIDLLSLMAKKLDINIEQIHTNNINEAKDYLINRTCDILPVSSKYELLNDIANFSNPILSYKLAIITQSGKPVVQDLDEIIDKKKIPQKKFENIMEELELDDDYYEELVEGAIEQDIVIAHDEDNIEFENDEKLSHDDVDLLLIGLIATNLFYA